MTRITEKDYAALTGKKTPRDSSHERDAPEAERMPAHVHSGIMWQHASIAVVCHDCQKGVHLAVLWLEPEDKRWRCLDCALCPECGKTARQLWEAANKR